jgi:hypothetical protein
MNEWKPHLIWSRIVAGGKDGVLFGFGYSAYAVVLFVFRGPAFFAAQGVGLLELIALYLAGGAMAGAVCGALKPLTDVLIGRILVGIIAALPFAFLLGLTVLPPEDVRPGLVPVALMAASIWGVLGGLIFWHLSD